MIITVYKGTKLIQSIYKGSTPLIINPEMSKTEPKKQTKKGSE